MALPRRTFLRGMGATVALPLLDAMVPALSAASQTAAAPVRRLGFVYIPNGAIMDQWTPAAEGKAFELSPILKPLEALRDRLTVVSEPRFPPRGSGRGRGLGRSRARERGLAVRCPSEAHRGRGRARREDHRPDRGRRAGPRHPASLAGDRRGRLHGRGRLRHRLRLQLREHAVVAHADHPAADADRPARRLRAAVRRGARRRAAPPPAHPGSEHPRRDRRPGRAAAEAPRRGRHGSRERIPRQRARGRAARPEDGGARRSSISAFRRCRSACRISTTTTSG